MRLYKPMMD